MIKNSRPNWWRAVKYASDAWKEQALAEGIDQSIIDWADKLVRGREGALWFARLASKNPPELHPGQDDNQIESILSDWSSYGSFTGKNNIEDFASKTEYSQAIGLAQQQFEGSNKGSWEARRKHFSPSLKPASTFSLTGGKDVYASYLIDSPDDRKTLDGISAYCVRSEVGFKYNPHRYFLVTHNGSIFALIHPESQQCKDSRDAELAGCDRAVAMLVAFKPIEEAGRGKWAEENAEQAMSVCAGSSLGMLLEMAAKTSLSLGKRIVEKLGNDASGPFAMSIILSHERGTLPKGEMYEILYRKCLEAARANTIDMNSVIKASDPDVDGMFRTIMWMHDDGKRRKDEAYLAKLRDTVEKSVSFKRADIMDVDLKTMRKMVAVLQSLGASERLTELHKVQNAYLVSQAHRTKTRLQADHDEAPLLAKGDPATIMWYYAHVARGRTVPNQQPNTGKPWPALEGKIMEWLQVSPVIAKNTLRQYLGLVAEPKQRLSGMAEAAAKLGLTAAFASIIPAEFQAANA